MSACVVGIRGIMSASKGHMASKGAMNVLYPNHLLKRNHPPKRTTSDGDHEILSQRVVDDSQSIDYWTIVLMLKSILSGCTW